MPGRHHPVGSHCELTGRHTADEARTAVALSIGVPLARDHAAAIEAIIGRLRARTDWIALAHPSPHLTLLVLLEAPPLDTVDEIIRKVARRTPVFPARARGYGVFADEHEQLVLYTPVVRSDALTRLHRSLFDAFDDIGAGVDGHYYPEAWLPHITLCNRDLTPEVLGELVASMATARAISWRLNLDRVARFGPDVETSTFSLSAPQAPRGNAP
jgi:2'-5' RNA ligase